MTKKLRDIKIIDVRKSEVDVEATKKKGIPVFSKKTYYAYRDNTGLSPWWFYWAPKDDDAQLNWLMNAQNYEYVSKSDPYVPEGAKLNSEQKYQYGDLVLLKCPLIEYIERRMEARKLAEAKVKSRKNQFNEEIMKDGGQALTEEQLQSILGD